MQILERTLMCICALCSQEEKFRAGKDRRNEVRLRSVCGGRRVRSDAERGLRASWYLNLLSSLYCICPVIFIDSSLTLVQIQRYETDAIECGLSLMKAC